MYNGRFVVRTPCASTGQYQHDLSLQVYSVDLRSGIMPYINNFGHLYHARLTKSDWCAKFVEVKQQLLGDMFRPVPDADVVQNVDFKLRQIDLARTVQHWRFPLLLDVRNNRVEWINGHSRLLASAINWHDAWTRVFFLIFVPHTEKEPSQSRFAFCQEISNDTQLRQVLGDRMTNDDPLVINAAFETDGSDIRFRLRGIQCGNMPAADINDRSFYQAWHNWLANSEATPWRMQASVDNAALIRDSSGKWSINRVGSPARDLVSFAQMSAHIWREKQSDIHHDVWQFYHFGKGAVDIADFFFWVDPEHTVYHTHDWTTILVKPSPAFKCKEISLSGQ